MVAFADGGLMSSKPYAASGAYINRMSDYCAPCRYKPTAKTGPTACPFNYLYWNFMLENRPKLGANQRLSMVYRNLDRMDDARQDQIRTDAVTFLNGLSATPDDAPEQDQMSLDI